MSNVIQFSTPEGDHLAEQERLLNELTDQLAARETEFATQGTEFHRFRAGYLHRFAPLYSELDRLEAEIARLLAVKQDTPESRRTARETAERAAASEDSARQTSGRAGPEGEAEEPRSVDPDLRDLFRRAAKSLHPDTANSEEERERRTRLMAAVNQAYERGDAEAIRRIVEGESARPEAVEGNDTAARLVRTLRKIAQVRARFDELVELQQALERDPMWRLFVDSRDEWLAGGDPLAADEADLRRRILSAEARLEALRMSGAL
jgi:hypothetical protein